jgi:hypothetical protein
MGKWIKIQNKNYQTPVKSFNWNENRNALVVKYKGLIEAIVNEEEARSDEREAMVTATEFRPVPQEFYIQLKDEVEDQEKLVGERDWFFEDIQTPNDIKKKIERESSVSEFDMSHRTSP